MGTKSKTISGPDVQSFRSVHHSVDVKGRVGSEPTGLGLGSNVRRFDGSRDC